MVTGCGAGGPRSTDTLICKKFAAAVRVMVSPRTKEIDRYTLFARALTLGRNEARRAGYLSPRLAGDLRVLTSGKCNLGSAPQAFAADCRATGVKGMVWLAYAGSCG